MGSCRCVAVAVTAAAGQLRRDRICPEDLIRACLLVAHGISPDSIRLHRPDDPTDSGSEMVRAACHEAGGAVAAETLAPGSVSMVCIHNETDGSHGFTSYCSVPGQHGLRERTDIILRSLAGRAALEVCFGRPELGAGHDLAHARREAVMTSELERFYLRAKEILTENRAFLNAVIAALLDRGILTGEDVRQLREANRRGA